MSCNPDLYRILTHTIEYDLASYLGFAQQFRGPILELGAGTGRVTQPLLEHDHEVTALDHDPEMIAQLQHLKSCLPSSRAACFEIAQQSMVRFEFDKKFSLILIPLRTYQLLSPVQRSRCLESCIKHLSANGALCVHIGAFDVGPLPQPWVMTWEGPGTDGWLEVEECCYLSSEQRICLRHRIHLSDSSGHIKATWRVAHQLYPLDEFDVHQELAESGFGRCEQHPLGNDTLWTATLK